MLFQSMFYELIIVYIPKCVTLHYGRHCKITGRRGGKTIVAQIASNVSHQTSNVQPVVERPIPFATTSRARSLDTCVPRTILLFGKMGHGKSTLGNRILNSDGWFKINDQQYPQTSLGSSMLNSVSKLKDYKIKVYDHSGLFEGASSIDELSSEKLNLVIFVLKRGYDFDESEVTMLKSVMSELQISGISSLILTHCEHLSAEEREEMIEQFKKDHPSIAELMGKGILSRISRQLSHPTWITAESKGGGG